MRERLQQLDESIKELGLIPSPRTIRETVAAARDLLAELVQEVEELTARADLRDELSPLEPPPVFVEDGQGCARS